MEMTDTSTEALLKHNLKEMSLCIYGNWISQVTYVFAELGLANAFISGPQTLEQLADFGGVKPAFLKRMLRTTFELGFLTYDQETELYSLTPKGDILSDNHPQSMREEARLNGAPYRYHPWGNLINILRNGLKEEYSPTLKDGSLEYLKDKPELLNTFHTALSNKSEAENLAIVKDYDFSPYTKVMDIGCGKGTFMMTILDENPRLKGYLFDLAATLEFDLPEKYQGRLEKAPGDFFKEIPGTADCYTMKNVIHNWPEDKAIKLLQGVCNAMKSQNQIGTDPKDKRLLIVENLLPENDDHKIASWMDLNFMIIIGGSERTSSEFQDLASRAGLKLVGVEETSSGRHILAFAIA